MREALRRLLGWLSILPALMAAADSAAAVEEPVQIIERVRSAYARVSDYQVLVESVVWEGATVREETQNLYRFKKPAWIRVDFLHPREGWVLVYPSDSGKVSLRPAGLLRFLKLSLDPGSSLLTVWPGQQVPQTDLGSLIENMARSLTDRRLGPADVSRAQGEIIVRVKAENHFLEGAPTLYELRIDAVQWLPAEVREELLGTGRKRQVRFRELRTNVGLPDSLFRLP